MPPTKTAALMAIHRWPAAPNAAPASALTVASRLASGMMTAWFLAPRFACAKWRSQKETCKASQRGFDWRIMCSGHEPRQHGFALHDMGAWEGVHVDAPCSRGGYVTKSVIWQDAMGRSLAGPATVSLPDGLRASDAERLSKTSGHARDRDGSLQGTVSFLRTNLDALAAAAAALVDILPCCVAANKRNALYVRVVADAVDRVVGAVHDAAETRRGFRMWKISARVHIANGTLPLVMVVAAHGGETGP